MLARWYVERGRERGREGRRETETESAIMFVSGEGEKESERDGGEGQQTPGLKSWAAPRTLTCPPCASLSAADRAAPWRRCGSLPFSVLQILKSTVFLDFYNALGH